MEAPGALGCEDGVSEVTDYVVAATPLDRRCRVRNAGPSRDLKVAIAVGPMLELVLVVLDLVAKSNLTGRNNWLEISQLPGAEIAPRIILASPLRVGEYSSILAVVVCYLIQSFLLTAVILGLIGACRVIMTGIRRKAPPI